MTTFKALVRDKQTNKRYIMTMDYPTKKEFIQDIRANGLQVTDHKVKNAQLFDWICDNTNAGPKDWKINQIPKEEL